MSSAPGQVVPLQMGQPQVIGGIDVQPLLDCLGIIFFLSMTMGDVLG